MVYLVTVLKDAVFSFGLSCVLSLPVTDIWTASPRTEGFEGHFEINMFGSEMGVRGGNSISRVGLSVNKIKTCQLTKTISIPPLNIHYPPQAAFQIQCRYHTDLWPQLAEVHASFQFSVIQSIQDGIASWSWTCHSDGGWYIGREGPRSKQPEERGC